MLIERQAKDIINQHIDMINLKENLSLIEHEMIKGEKPLKSTQSSARVKFSKVAH